MAVNTSRAWTGSTIAPQVTPAAAPAVGTATIPASLPQGQFYNSLLSSLFGMGGSGGGGGGSSAPQMHPAQANAINFAIQQIGAENWNRERDAGIRNWFSPTPAGAGGLQGVPTILAPMGGGFLPAYNPMAEQFLSNQRLAAPVSMGTAASAFGSGGFNSPMGGAPRSGWTPSPWGF